MRSKKTTSKFSALTASPRGRLALLVLAVLFGFALRLFQLNEMSLRGDETFTVMHWMREPLSQTLAEIRTIDPQPPLAYATYFVYGQIMGTQENIVRFLPALLNTIGIAAAYGVGKRIMGARAGLALAVMVAAAPHILWHAQDARNYSLWSAASLLSLWLALRLIQRGNRIDFIMYIIAAAAACYLYYLELFFVAALNVHVVFAFWRQWQVWRRWFSAQIILGVLLAVWFLQPDLLTGGGYGGTAGQLDPVRYITWFLPELLFGNTLPASLSLLATLFALAATVGGLGLLWRSNWRNALLLTASIVIPAALLGIVSTRINVFVPRYILAAVPFLMLCVIVVVSWLWNKRGVVRALGVLTAASYMGFVCVSLFVYYLDYTKSPLWRELSSTLATLPGEDIVIVNSSADVALSFYLNEQQSRHEELYLPANPRQPADEITAILADRLADHQRLLLVTSANPDWPNAAVPDAFLSESAALLWTRQIAGQPARMYAPLLSVDAQTLPLASFGNVVALMEYDITPPTASDPFYTIVSVWQPLLNTQRPLTYFAHLTGSTNPATGTPLWAQDDGPPADGRLLSTAWEDAGLFYQVFEIPSAALPSGTYQIVVGLYDTETGERLTTEGADAHPLTTIDFTP
ncbi:MAG: glycosyltransferase family 39 protein [Pleurocapsa minor GSE-CHR-MK-17-07R]|jgi:4-amino-4-deoxy-L-arabinose transferase-like glycosyltransferase|nr:glycosyltransferase family 39 protein [Pleurocapsa minor GSE-CHR-MK 17-07R]